MGIQVKKTICEVEVTPPRKEIYSYVGNDSKEYNTLFGAIKANHGIPPLKVDDYGYYASTMYKYFTEHEDVRDRYEQQVHFMQFHYREDLFCGFVCSSEEDVEVAILLLGYYTGLDVAWERIDYQRTHYAQEPYDRFGYPKSILAIVYHILLEAILLGGSVAYYFGVDDRGDSLSFDYDFLPKLKDKMRSEIDELEAEVQKVSDVCAQAQT